MSSADARVRELEAENKRLREALLRVQRAVEAKSILTAEDWLGLAEAIEGADRSALVPVSVGDGTGPEGGEVIELWRPGPDDDWRQMPMDNLDEVLYPRAEFADFRRVAPVPVEEPDEECGSCGAPINRKCERCEIKLSGESLCWDSEGVELCPACWKVLQAEADAEPSPAPEIKEPELLHGNVGQRSGVNVAHGAAPEIKVGQRWRHMDSGNIATVTGIDRIQVEFRFPGDPEHSWRAASETQFRSSFARLVSTPSEEQG